ncbi:hypothetical protein E1267_31440 [Nonomuraea longispora]|uniref:Uncharacterized protein n=1 Tax=Nonomuraea longispora TaxID=1848320 RepID=A0A4R4N3C5_9ACTN|nr:hypothetical protein E1267_31440 [Nonomuraea longispora]
MLALDAVEADDLDLEVLGHGTAGFGQGRSGVLTGCRGGGGRSVGGRGTRCRRGGGGRGRGFLHR